MGLSTWIGVIVLVAVISAAPFIRERLRPTLSEAQRGAAPGQYMNLADGDTYFQWQGPEGGPVVVLIHGLTTPSFVWRSISWSLSVSGYRVLSYDLFGRGFSDRPKGLQDRVFFVSQLSELLDREKIDRDLTLIGYSMGGAIATCFASMYPSRIRQIILLAPAGMHRFSSGMIRLVRDVPGLGDWLMLLVYPTILRRGLDAEKDFETSVPDVNTLQRAELRVRGFIPAVLASVRGILSEPLALDHRCIAKWEIPVLAIWGSDDDVIPERSAARLADWNSEADQEVIQGAGHGLTYTHTDEVMRLITRWMV